MDGRGGWSVQYNRRRLAINCIEPANSMAFTEPSARYGHVSAKISVIVGERAKRARHYQG